MQHVSSQKIALVTGGGPGLGYDTALRLADKGVDVILTYNTNFREAQNVAESIRERGRQSSALKLDTRDIRSFDDFVAQVCAALDETWNTTRLDYLVNGVSTESRPTFADTTEGQFDEMMCVHAKGVFFLTQKMLPLLSNGGRIINLSGGLAHFALAGVRVGDSNKGIEVFNPDWAARRERRSYGTRREAPLQTNFPVIQQSPDWVMFCALQRFKIKKAEHIP